MSLPSNGITADVIRDIMPPYRLSADLLDAAFHALPPPPADASAAWRHQRIARLIGEITALKPADAGQARTAAQVLSLRELADTILNRAYVPEVTLPQLCRLGRAAAELARTASGLVRGLERTQQKPVPFYGTVVDDEVDIAALDGIWCRRTPVAVGAGSVQQQQDPLEGRGDLSADAGLRGAAGSGPAMTDSASDDRPIATVRQPAPAHFEPDADPTLGSALGPVVTRLNQGPGWTLDVVRRRPREEACAGTAQAAGAAFAVAGSPTSAGAFPAGDGSAPC